MANPIKGQVDFPVGDTVYRLELSINSIIEVEDLLDMGVVEIAEQFGRVAKMKSSFVRAVLWGALQTHHPDIDLLAAGDIITRARLLPTIRALARALELSFPQDAGDGARPRVAKGGGSGKTSSSRSRPSSRMPKSSGA